MKKYSLGCVVNVSCGDDFVNKTGIVVGVNERESLIDVLFMDENPYFTKSFYDTYVDIVEDKVVSIVDDIDFSKYVVLKKINTDIFYFLTNMNDTTADIVTARKFSKQTLIELDIPIVESEKDAVCEAIYGGLYLHSHLVGIRLDMIPHIGESETIIFRNGNSDTLRQYLENKYTINGLLIK